MTQTEPNKRRLHPLAAVLGALRVVRALIPLLLVTLVTQRDTLSPGPTTILIPGAVLSLIIGVGGWLRFRYWTEAGELRVERGLLIRRRVFIPSDRVQAIDVSSGLFQQALGLVSVQVKTAARGTQAELTAVSVAEAERLRQVLGVDSEAAARAQPQEQAAKDTTTNTGAPAQAMPPRGLDDASAPAEAAVTGPRYFLSNRHLIVAASTSSRLGALLSAIGWLYTQMTDVVNERLVTLARTVNLEATIASAGPAIVIVGVAAALLISWAGSVLAELARFGGFSVRRVDQQIVITRGVFERREIAIRIDRIQAILIVESVLRQPLGYATLMIESAGHSERGQSTQLHPLLKRDEIRAFLEHIAPTHAVEMSLSGPPRRAIPRFLVKPILLSLAALGVLSAVVSWGWFLTPLVAGAVLLGWLRYRDSGASTLGSTLVLRRRTLQRTTTIAERRRVQFARVEQSLFQRRRQVADFTVGIASGSGRSRHSTPELDQSHAARLLRWCGDGAVVAGASPHRAEAPAGLPEPT